MYYYIPFDPAIPLWDYMEQQSKYHIKDIDIFVASLLKTAKHWQKFISRGIVDWIMKYPHHAIVGII